MAIDPREFRNTLGRFATGITVVSVPHGDEVRGMTVTSFMSLSLNPPLVTVSIDKRAKTHALLMRAERYGVSVLAEGQLELSDLFAGRPGGEVEVAFDYPKGFPVLKDAVAQLVCRVYDIVDAGDHTLFIGEVEHLAHREDKPLLYYAGRYAQLGALETSLAGTA